MKAIKRIVLSCSLLLILIAILFSSMVSAGKKLTTEAELKSGPNIGNYIYVTKGDNEPVEMVMNNPKREIYCVQDHANVPDNDENYFTVCAYAKIEGNKLSITKDRK